MKFALSFFLIFSCIVSSGYAQTPKKSVRETIINKKHGFLTCSGGTQSPLFKQDCKLLVLERVSFGGDFKYEAQCKDSSGITFFISCIAFSFEPDRAISVPNPEFIQ